MKLSAKQMLKFFLPFIAVVALFAVVLIWQAGLFEQPELKVESRDPVLYIYLEEQGPYSQIIRAKKELDQALADLGVKGLIPCIVYLNDLATTETNRLRWQIGMTVRDSVRVSEPVKLGRIPGGKFIVATIHAHPAVAAQKTFPALNRWLQDNKQSITGAAVEYHLPDGWVEAMFPIGKE